MNVPPTLVHAVHALSSIEDRGFVFMRADGTERSCSFAEIYKEARRRAGHFAAKGIKRGDRIAIVVPDPDEFVLSFLGATFAGGVPVPIYPQLSFKNVETYHDTVAHIVNASGAALLLTTESTKQFVEPVIPRTKELREMITVSDLAPEIAPVEIEMMPSDLAFLQFTSGSTSRPKGVMVTHGNLAANTGHFTLEGLQRTEIDKGISWLPLFHDMGLIGFVIAPLFTNIPIVFIPTATFVRSPRIWLETIHKHRGTITYAPNFAYALVSKRLKEKDVAGLDLSCVRIAGCGAEPIQAKTLREFADKLAPAGFDPASFLPSYGMAESTLAITFTPLRQGLRIDRIDSVALQKHQARTATEGDANAQDLVCCGKSFAEHELIVVDEQGNRLGERQVGEIWTRGPSVCAGYFREPELTAETFRDGWLHSGDLGYIADGQIYICGRIKDIIIIRGRNFYPSDIEWVVSELPGIRRGNVVAFGVTLDTEGRHVEDGTGEEHLVVCAEALQSDATALSESIQNAVVGQIGVAVHKVEIVAQGALPRTSSGKPQRRKTKQMWLDGVLLRRRSAEASGDPA